ncbi:hypothetical protein ACP70R_044850 [Stipagrostis hirtigluma subsp. patula]
MAPMASMLLRVSRDARSVIPGSSAVASRRAQGDLTISSTCRSFGCVHDDAATRRPPPPCDDGPPHAAGSSFSDQQGGAILQPKKCAAVDPRRPAAIDDEDEDEFVVEDKDVESDEALWALYERWCDEFSVPRRHGEMARHFDAFKRTVLWVHHWNKDNSDDDDDDRPYRKLVVNEWADGRWDDDYARGSSYYD